MTLIQIGMLLIKCSVVDIVGVDHFTVVRLVTSLCEIDPACLLKINARVEPEHISRSYTRW